jgi:hypothetical protein|tara:strand:- start:100 stop:306 length:207 start_codon:yes stop_codon:yes gene_type:complete
MAQEFTISITDALWADVKEEISTAIDSTIIGDITVGRMTTYLNETVDYHLKNVIKGKKVKDFKKSLES